MDNKLFEKGMELQDRIMQLKALKNWMQLFLEKKPFHVEINASVFGTTSTIPMTYESEVYFKHRLNNGLDIEFVINQIQKRIDDLQVVFNNL